MWILYRDKTCINDTEYIRIMCINEQMGSIACSDVCLDEANEGGRGWLFCFSKRQSASAFFHFFLGFDREVGELLVHRRIMTLLQSKHISHALLCWFENVNEEFYVHPEIHCHLWYQLCNTCSSDLCPNSVSRLNIQHEQKWEQMVHHFRPSDPSLTIRALWILSYSICLSTGEIAKCGIDLGTSINLFIFN